MSRLDSMIRRLEAQRDGIAWAEQEIADLEGDVIEIGLGNGRTYDHLRQRLPDREIWVIERAPSPHPDSMPPAERLLAMEADVALASLVDRGVRAALIHYDLGVGLAEIDHPLAASLSPPIASALTPGGVVVANNPIMGLPRVDGPASVPRDRYYFYRSPLGV